MTSLGLVATVLTVYGIETFCSPADSTFYYCHVATVLTVYGIETIDLKDRTHNSIVVATVLTVYGIETSTRRSRRRRRLARLQQYLPFTVLKLLAFVERITLSITKLQQYLPFTVLKLQSRGSGTYLMQRCNSTYRLRY